MANKPSKDFRASRSLLPDEVFLLPPRIRKRPEPTNLVSEEVWDDIMHLADDVALTTSNHHGSQLATLCSLHRDWVTAIGDDPDQPDELFGGMLDAADCLQASTFDSLHGYYRSAISNLRSAVELIAIGTLGNLAPRDPAYIRWKKRNIGSLPFKTCIRKLRGATQSTGRARVLKSSGWAEALYEELCPYTHARPDASDGELWRSNGPIYVASAFSAVFKFQVSTYAAGYVLTKVGRQRFALPKDSEFLFKMTGLLWRDEIASSYHTLCSMP
jgi:hypothetical protein